MGSRRMRRIEAEYDLAEDLRFTANVLYYRWEFARGMERESPYEPRRGGFFNEATGQLLRLERVFGRKKFLAEPGGRTYLEDLKSDLRGPMGKDLKGCVCADVEVHGAPPSSCSLPDMTPVRPPSFFPKASELDGRLEDYFDQLMKLQDFFHNELGVTPGSLLPVWVAKKGCKKDGELPEFGVRPVRRRIVDALIGFLLWQQSSESSYYHEKRLEGASASSDFLDRCLEYGWTLWNYHLHEGAVYDSLADDLRQLGIPVSAEEIDAMNSEELMGLLEKLPEDHFLRSFPVTEKEMLRRLFCRVGLPPKPRLEKMDAAPDEDDGLSEKDRKLREGLVSPAKRDGAMPDRRAIAWALNDPNTKKKAALAAKRGFDLYGGDAYWDLW